MYRAGAQAPPELDEADHPITVHRRPDEPLHRRAHNDLSRPGRLLQPPERGYRSEGQRLRAADHDLASINGRTHLRGGYCSLGLERGAYRTEGVVLVRRREPEERDDFLAKQSFDAAAVPRHDSLDLR
jgi:hypothetical protein